MRINTKSLSAVQQHNTALHKAIKDEAKEKTKKILSRRKSFTPSAIANIYKRIMQEEGNSIEVREPLSTLKFNIAQEDLKERLYIIYQMLIFNKRANEFKSWD